MRRIGRYILNGLTLLSLLLCVVTVVLWVRTTGDRGDRLGIVRGHYGFGLVSLPSTTQWTLARYERPPGDEARAERCDSGDQLIVALSFGRTAMSVLYVPDDVLDARHWRAASVADSFKDWSTFDQPPAPPDYHLAYLVCPHWAVGLLLGLLPTGRGVRIVLRRVHAARRPAGHCPACGYDLRATPAQCPECGLPARRGPAPPSAAAGEGGPPSA